MPLHPYTRALLSAVPVPDPVVEDTRERILLTGRPAVPGEPALGLPLPHPVPRGGRQTRCDTERPVLRTVTIESVPGTHRVACHFVEQIASGELQPHAVETLVVDPTLVESGTMVPLIVPISLTEVG